MEIKELQKRIEKKAADIEKLNRRVAKWNKGWTAEEEQVAQTLNWKTVKTYATEHNFDWEKADRFHEYYAALSDLNDAANLLNKYKNNLALEEAKAGAPRIEVIMTFLTNWKQDMVEYIKQNAAVKVEYGKVDSEICELHNHRYYLIHNEMTEEEWKKKYEELGKKRRALKAAIHPFTDMTVNYKGQLDEAKLEELLNKEVEAKYWSMVDKVTAITGEITDASYLKIGGDGNLNGIIAGEKGRAHLETILAGGINENVIVNVKHGQCLHYRLLCHAC